MMGVRVCGIGVEWVIDRVSGMFVSGGRIQDHLVGLCQVPTR